MPFPVVADVPPVDLRDGQHFKEYSITIYDPLTGHVCVNKVDVSGTCSSTYIRNPFPGDVLPASRISPIGQKILSYYPAPNAPGFTQNFVFANSTGQYRYDQPMFRWDRVIDPADRVYTLFTFQHGHEYRNQTGIPEPAVGGNIWTQRTDFNIIADWTRILSPTAIFDLRTSFGRFTSYFPDGDTSTGITAQDLGMNVVHAPTSTTNFPPRFTVDQFSNLFGNGSNLYTWGTDNQFNIVPTVTLTRGTKTIKFGADLVYAMQGTGSIGQANGQFGFTRYATQQYPLYTGSSTNGSGVGDLLLGMPGSGFVDWNDTFYRTWPYFGFFVQNDWKVARNLTLNLGARYDVQVPWVERWNRVNTGFDFHAVNPLSSQVLSVWQQDQAAYNATNPTFAYPAPPPALLGGKTFIVPGGPRRTYLTDWQNIQPRVGLAWMFAKDTVLRTGFGLYHATATQANYTDGFSQQTPYIRSTNGDLTPDAALTGPYSLANPFPNGLIQPSGAALGLLTNVGNAVSFDGSQRVIPRTFQYSFGLQRRIWWSVLLDASYVGSITDHVTMADNMDYIPMSDYQVGHVTNSFLNRTVPNPFYGILPSNTTFGASQTITAQYLYYPYPLFNGITMSTNPWGRYRYDSLQLRAEKRFLGNRNLGGALTMIFSYTFSKNFQTVNRLNNWDYAETPVHELVSYDKPQNLSASGVWDLPFGKGRHFFAGANRLVDSAIGGWTVNLIYRYNSGFPIAGMNDVFSCASLLIPDQIHDQWFNNTKSCFKSLPAYTVRTVPDRYPWLRQMDNNTVNLAAAKTFPITDRWRFNLRAEAFNLMNHPLYGAPDTTYTDARFGMLPVGQQNFPRLIQISAKVLF